MTSLVILLSCQEKSPPSDYGSQCDPSAVRTDCNQVCVETSSEQVGICTLRCLGDNDQACPGDSTCQALQVSGEMAWLCMPDLGCGDVSFSGECEGDVLNYCGSGGVERIDCSQFTDGSGAPMTCQLVSESYGVDCVPATYSGECGDVTPQGRCLDTGLMYCESYETGRVLREECQADEVCTLDEWGIAQCLPASTTGCGGISTRGQCSGDGVIWCEQDTLYQKSCSDQEQCRFIDQIFDCFDIAEGTNQVIGQWFFERPEMVTSIDDPEVSVNKAPIERPIRGALVQLYDEDFQVHGSSITDEEGRFEITHNVTDARSLFVAVLSISADEAYPVEVIDCPECTRDHSQANLYAVSSDLFTAGDPQVDLGIWVVDGDQAGAFNIFDLMIKGVELVGTLSDQSLPPLLVEWAPGQFPHCLTSCSGVNAIWINGAVQDPDHFDDSVIAHEFAHFAEFYISKSDSPGGFHDGSPTVPTLAWGEGYASYFSALLKDHPLYLDYFPSAGDVRWSIDEVVPADINHPRGVSQPLSEYTVSGILWFISREYLSSRDIFRSLVEYIKQPHSDGGVSGVDLVDFLNGLYCLNIPTTDLVSQLVVGRFQFPFPPLSQDRCN